MPLGGLTWFSSLPSSEELTPEQKKEGDLTGYYFNTRRGTANFFTCKALQEFLKKNSLSFVIRAHEVQQVGFQVREMEKGGA